MDAALHERPLGVQEAYDALDRFGRDMGRVRLLLLLHAAVPQSFRADLLNLLKVNFLADAAGTDMTIDSDVLLSPLVQPAAAGYYRLDPEVRRHALALLDAAYRDRPVRRTIEVARFLLAHAEALERQAGLTLDPLLAEYLTVQRWVAVSFIDPHAAAEAFARALDGAVRAAAPAVALRLGSVTAAISVPLAGHEPLLAYARGVEAISRGNVDAGRRLLEWMGDGELRVGGVALRPPGDVIERLAPGAAAGATAARAPILVGVPEKEGVVAGHDAELALARERLLAPADPVTGPNALWITGPEGIGKWTLANALAHDPAIRQFFADGIVWLGEDGNGYPTAAFREYAKAVAASEAVGGRGTLDEGARNARAQQLLRQLLDEQGRIRPEGFRNFFEKRRVLFISEQRTASEIYPLLVAAAASSCAVLHLSPSTLEGVPSIELKPLENAYAHAAFTRQIGGGREKAWLRDPLIDFAQGIPLLIRLVEGALSQAGVGREREIVGQLGDFNRWSVSELVGQALRALWNSLSETDRNVLGQTLLRLPQGRTRFRRLELADSGVASPEDFLNLVFARQIGDVLGETVRFHPLVRAMLDTLVQEERAREGETEDAGEMPGAEVFISYAREDAQAARSVQAALNAVGLRTFVDLQLLPGADVAAEIASRIKGAAAFVPILSRAATTNSQSFHHHEWRLAIEESRRRSPAHRFIFPITIEDISADDPAVPEAFRRIHWASAEGGAVSAGLVEAVRRAVRESRRRPEEPAEGRADPRTEDYAIVIGLSKYPRLGIFIEGSDHGARAVHQWLMARDQGGLEPTRVRLMQSDDLEAAGEQAIQQELFRLATASSTGDQRLGRRLYVYAAGLVGLADERTSVLLMPHASQDRLYSLDLLEWVHWFRRAGTFDEFVVWIDGSRMLERFSRAEPVSLVPPPPRSPPGPLFVAVALRELEFGRRKQRGAANEQDSFTEYLLEALVGRGRDERTGRVTSESLAAALQNWPRRAQSPDVQRPRIEVEGEIVFAERLS